MPSRFWTSSSLSLSSDDDEEDEEEEEEDEEEEEEEEVKTPGQSDQHRDRKQSTNQLTIND